MKPHGFEEARKPGACLEAGGQPRKATMGSKGSSPPTLFLIGLLVFNSLLVYQQSIVKPNDLSKVNLAFMTANGIASIVFSIFVITGIILTF